MKYPHYFKDVTDLDSIDVYRVLELFHVTNPCLRTQSKKLLVAGGRGRRTFAKDVAEAIDTLERWQEMRAEDDDRRRCCVLDQSLRERRRRGGAPSGRGRQSMALR